MKPPEPDGSHRKRNPRRAPIGHATEGAARPSQLLHHPTHINDSTTTPTDIARNRLHDSATHVVKKHEQTTLRSQHCVTTHRPTHCNAALRGCVRSKHLGPQPTVVHVIELASRAVFGNSYCFLGNMHFGLCPFQAHVPQC